MPPLPPELASYLVLLPVLGAIVLPPTAGLVVLGVVRGLGVDAVALPGLPHLRWSVAAGVLTFLLGVCAVVALLAGGAQDVVADVAGLLVRMGAAGCCLFVGAWASAAQEAVAECADRRNTSPPSAPNRTLGLAIAGLAALAALVGAGGAVLLVAAALLVLGVVALGGGELGDLLRDLLRDIAAGIELRQRATAGTVVHVDGRDVTIAARPGLLSTHVSSGPPLENRHLLAALEKPQVARISTEG